MASVKFGQIRPEIWPKPNLAEFWKNGRISDLPKPKPKFGATLVFSSSKCTKIRFRPRDPAGGAYDASPDPLVGWGGGYPLSIPLPARRLQRLELGAYGASVHRPPSTQNPGYASGRVFMSFNVDRRIVSVSVTANPGRTFYSLHSQQTRSIQLSVSLPHRARNKFDRRSSTALRVSRNTAVRPHRFDVIRSEPGTMLGSITVRHGSADTVVRAIGTISMGNAIFRGLTAPKPFDGFSKKFAQLITSATPPHMQMLRSVGSKGACLRMREVVAVRRLFFMSPLGDIYSFASWQNRHF